MKYHEDAPIHCVRILRLLYFLDTLELTENLRNFIYSLLSTINSEFYSSIFINSVFRRFLSRIRWNGWSIFILNSEYTFYIYEYSCLYLDYSLLMKDYLSFIKIMGKGFFFLFLTSLQLLKILFLNLLIFKLLLEEFSCECKLTDVFHAWLLLFEIFRKVFFY